MGIIAYFDGIFAVFCGDLCYFGLDYDTAQILQRVAQTVHNSACRVGQRVHSSGVVGIGENANGVQKMLVGVNVDCVQNR